MDSSTSRYHVEVESSVVKQIQRLQRQEQERVMRAILELADEPRPPNCTKLVGTHPAAYRVRVGQFRIVYTVDDGESREVTVTRVGHRREVYK